MFEYFVRASGVWVKFNFPRTFFVKCFSGLCTLHTEILFGEMKADITYNAAVQTLKTIVAIEHINCSCSLWGLKWQLLKIFKDESPRWRRDIRGESCVEKRTTLQNTEIEELKVCRFRVAINYPMFIFMLEKLCRDWMRHSQSRNSVTGKQGKGFSVNVFNNCFFLYCDTIGALSVGKL